jgi:hypothetical protein
MKFQPSKASVTPIQGYSNAYYCDNKYIPSTSVLDLEVPTHNNNEENEEKDSEVHDNDDDCNGRVLRYETVTITSPVLASARLVQRTTKRYVTDNDVNELNDKLQSLLLNTRNDEKEDDDDDTNINHRSDKKHLPLVVELTQREQATTTYFGRCSLVVYNSMTHSFVEVIRSARLAFSSA